MIVYLAQDITAFAVYYVNGESRSSLLIESTDSMILEYTLLKSAVLYYMSYVLQCILFMYYTRRYTPQVCCTLLYVLCVTVYCFSCTTTYPHPSPLTPHPSPAPLPAHLQQASAAKVIRSDSPPTYTLPHTHTHTHKKKKAKQSVSLPLSGHAIRHGRNTRALSGPMSQCNATSWNRARNSQVD